MPEPFDRMRLRRTDSGLWVAQNDSADPPHALGLVVAEAPLPSRPTLVLPFRPVVRDGLMAYVTENDLGLRPLGKDGVVEVMSLLPSELTLMNLAVILKRVARSRQDAGAHLELAREIYGDAPVMDALGRFCAEEGRVVFSEQGLTALMAQAVVHCRPDSHHEFTADEWRAFQRVLLAAAGLLAGETDLGEPSQGEADAWLAYMTQNLLFNSTANFGSSLARTWRLFGELAIDEQRQWDTPLDFAAVLEATGLTIQEQLALAFGLYAVLGGENHNDLVAILPDGWRDVCERVNPTGSPDEVIQHIAATPAQMRTELTSDAAKRFDPELRWASVPFIERPFLRLEDDRILLVSPRGIERWPVDGMHYRLLRAASNLDLRSGAQHFTSFAASSQRSPRQRWSRTRTNAPLKNTWASDASCVPSRSQVGVRAPTSLCWRTATSF